MINKRMFFFSLVIVLALITACMDLPETIDEKTSAKSMDKAPLTKVCQGTTSSNVTELEVLEYLEYYKQVDASTIRIEPYVINQDTYLLIVSSDNKWYIFSCSYDTAPILAEGEGVTPFIGKDKLSDYEEQWLESLRQCIEEKQDDSSKLSRYYRHLWKDVRIKRSGSGVRSEEPDTSDNCIESVFDTTFYAYTNALTTTNWDQDAPFNAAVPLATPTTRCPAGCGPVATAQLLYYIYDNAGRLFPIYASASCSQYWNDYPYYNYNLSSLGTSTWALMPLNGSGSNTSYVAALYAYLANELDTRYLYAGSTYAGLTDFYDIADVLSNVFEMYTAETASYTRMDVITDLIAEKPVLCIGFPSSSSSVGHIFIIEGFEWTKIKETETVFDSNLNILEVNEYEYEFFTWDINTGESSGHHITAADYSYMSHRRLITTGWL